MPGKKNLRMKAARAAVGLSQADLAEAVGFDRDKALTIIRQVAPRAQILEVSARTGQGMAEWQAWLSS